MFNGFANVVLPARDLDAAVSGWIAVLGHEPAFVGDDFAVFTGKGVDIGLSSRPWVNYPLVFWRVDDIEQAHRTLLDRGARALGEISDGSLAELGMRRSRTATLQRESSTFLGAALPCSRRPTRT